LPKQFPLANQARGEAAIAWGCRIGRLIAFTMAISLDETVDGGE
jgi:hypothetical protein